MSFLGMMMLLTPQSVRADSDGYYCVGADYIAYQLRGWNWYNRGEHRLTVVRFGVDGPRLLGEVALGADFQPHAMDCGAREVVLQGFGEGYIRVAVALRETGLEVAELLRDPVRQFSPADFPTPLPNLGDYSRAGSTQIGDVGGTPVWLAILHHPVGGPRWCREVEAWVQIGDPEQPPRFSLQLYRGFAACEGPG
ncbi:MAG: hypothetical protein R3E98_15545 [Gemmatimonadota bacterium]